MFLKYLTRNNENPNRKARVYFCAHAEDHAAFLQTISQEILTLHDCAFWYASPDTARTPAFLDELKEMNLFVIPITRRLLTTQNYALRLEFAYAMEHHIPVLPLMQEPGLVGLFNEVCGNLQFLDPHTKDLTEISYKEKLKKYLNQVLLDDETIQKIQSAFDAYIFLSYRKTDRAFARELMQLIHENDFCRDVAIWYDEFLTPGEDFNDTIRAALEKSHLFVMAITPQMVAPAIGSTQDNYVVQKEYPMAKQAGKPILPVEMAQVDPAVLKQKFRDLPALTKRSNKAALASALSASFTRIALRQNQSPTHDFFIGLAYLKGIDVEVDHKKAVTLIQSAANAGVAQALETMVRIHGSGTGVERSLEKMLYWQEKLVAQRKEAYRLAQTLSSAVAMLEDIQALQQLCEELGKEEKALSAAKDLLDTATQLRQVFSSPEINRYFSAGCIYMGLILSAAGQTKQTQSLFSDSVYVLEQTLLSENIGLSGDEIQMPRESKPLHMQLLQDYCASLCNLGDTYMAEGDTATAQSLFTQCYQYLNSSAMRDNYPGYRGQRSTICNRMGMLAQANGDLSKARHYYALSVQMDALAAKEIVQTRDLDAFDALGRSLLAYAMLDENRPDAACLYAAITIWKTLWDLLPQFPRYRECYEELKPYADFWVQKARNEKKMMVGFYPIAYVSDAMYVLRKLEQKQQKIWDFAQLVNSVQTNPTPEKLMEAANGFLNGIVTPANPSLAIDYARRAAAMDYLPAMELLAEVDTEQGADFRKKAEALREKQRRADEVRRQIQQELQQVAQWQSEARRGDGQACLKLYEYYRREWNDSEARKWLDLALDQKYVPAYITAARYWWSQDAKKAKYYARLAVRHNDRVGCMFLAQEAQRHGNPLGKLYWDWRYNQMRRKESRLLKAHYKKRRKH